MQAIILVCDHPDIHKIKVPVTDSIERVMHVLLSKEQEKEVAKVCNCIRNNSIDRAKILLKYLRKDLKLKDNQITFLRTSVFDTAKEVNLALEYLFESNSKEDVLLYYSGHGLIGDKPGWSMGNKKYLFYEDMSSIFEKFSGRLAVINDCCYSLGMNSALKSLGDRYALFGPARIHSISFNTVLDSVLGYWRNRMIALPKVAAIGTLNNVLTDIPAYVTHPNYYNCDYGSLFKVLKTFKVGNAPSLRRGAEIDELFFPV